MVYEKNLNKLSLCVGSLLWLSFGMILLGGVVKNTGSSLACPDWPLCFGQLMPEMKGGVAIEHSHRLLGTLIGILTSLSVFFASKIRDKRPLLFKTSLLAFVLVVLQGLLGGLTVLVQISPTYSTLHLAISHIFYAVLIVLFLKTKQKQGGNFSTVYEKKISKLLTLTAGLLFFQIVLGAYIRHFGWGPACGLGWKSAVSCLDIHTNLQTFWPGNTPGKIHMLHRISGVVTFAMIIFGTLPFLKWAKAHRAKGVRGWIILSHIAVTTQVLLGMKVIGTHISNFAITLHLAFALILWSAIIVLKTKATHFQKESLL